MEIELVEHTLTRLQHSIYNEYADAFAIIHQNMTAVLEITGVVNPSGQTLNANTKAAARSAFESTKQRFFNHLLCSMKVPTLIRRIENDLSAGLAPVVQLVSTGEALMDRRLAKVPTSEWGDLSIDLTPREYVIEYLAHAFPTQLHKEVTDPESGKKTSVPGDRRGRQPDREPGGLRSQGHADRASGRTPAGTGCAGPADAPLRTRARGRNHRAHPKGAADRRRKGSPTGAAPQEQQLEPDRDHRVHEREEGDPDLLAQRRDRQVVPRGPGMPEPAPADALPARGGMAGRSGNPGTGKNTPDAPGVCADIPSDLHETSRASGASSRRLRGASTVSVRSRADSGTHRRTMGADDQALFKPADNFESQYALAALRQFFAHVTNGKVNGYSPELLYEKTGLKIVDHEGALLKTLPPMEQVLNRLLALRIEEQNFLFGELETIIDANIEQAIEAGTYNQGVEEIKADSVQMVNRETLYTDEHTGAETELVELKRRVRTKPLTAEGAVKAGATHGDGTKQYRLVVNQRSKRAGLVVQTATWYNEEGKAEPRVRILRPTIRLAMSAAELELSQWEHASAERWEETWNKEVEAVPEYEETRIWLVTGLLLPIWNRLPSEDMRVRRTTTDDGEPMVGRMLTMGEVSRTLERFGRENAVQVTPEEVWEQMENQGASFSLQENLRLARRRVMGIERMEVAGAYGSAVETLKKLGCRTEVIYYQTRVFAPTVRTLKKVLQRYPLTGGGA